MASAPPPPPPPGYPPPGLPPPPPTSPGLPPTRGGPSPGLLVAVGLLIALVASGLTALLVTRGGEEGTRPLVEEEATDRSSTEQPSDEPELSWNEPLAASQGFVRRINTFGPNMLDARGRLSPYIDGVMKLMTERFGQTFEDARSFPESLVKDAGYSRAVTLHSAGITSLSEDAAVAVVAFDITDTYPGENNPNRRVDAAARPTRWQVDLRHVGDMWLVDDYQVLDEKTDGPAMTPSWPEAQFWVPELIAAASSVAETVLTYDYRHLEQDVVEAQRLMTPEQQARHREVMSDLRAEALEQEAVVTSTVVGAGLIDGDGETAEVLVLVNQRTERRGRKPVIIPLWASFTMVNSGGEWVLDRVHH